MFPFAALDVKVHFEHDENPTGEVTHSSQPAIDERVFNY